MAWSITGCVAPGSMLAGVSATAGAMKASRTAGTGMIPGAHATHTSRNIPSQVVKEMAAKGPEVGHIGGDEITQPSWRDLRDAGLCPLGSTLSSARPKARPAKSPARVYA